MVATPRLALFDTAEESQPRVFGKVPVDAGKPPFDFNYHQEVADDAGVGFISPVAVRGGVALWVGDGWICAEGEYQPGFENSSHQVDLEPLWNARLDVRQRFSETVSCGGGLFTDRSAHAVPEHLSDFRVHYYGVAAGLELKTPPATEGD